MTTANCGINGRNARCLKRFVREQSLGFDPTKGEKKKVVEVVASAVQFLGGPRSDDTPTRAAEARPATPQSASRVEPEEMKDDLTEEVPF